MARGAGLAAGGGKLFVAELADADADDAAMLRVNQGSLLQYASVHRLFEVSVVAEAMKGPPLLTTRKPWGIGSHTITYSAATGEIQVRTEVNLLAKIGFLTDGRTLPRGNARSRSESATVFNIAA